MPTGEESTFTKTNNKGAVWARFTRTMKMSQSINTIESAWRCQKPHVAAEKCDVLITWSRTITWIVTVKLAPLHVRGTQMCSERTISIMNQNSEETPGAKEREGVGVKTGALKASYISVKSLLWLKWKRFWCSLRSSECSLTDKHESTNVRTFTQSLTQKH